MGSGPVAFGSSVALCAVALWAAVGEGRSWEAALELVPSIGRAVEVPLPPAKVGEAVALAVGAALEAVALAFLARVALGAAGVEALANRAGAGGGAWLVDVWVSE